MLQDTESSSKEESGRRNEWHGTGGLGSEELSAVKQDAHFAWLRSRD